MSIPMNDLGVVRRNIVRADKTAVEKLSRFGVATIHEAMGRVGLMLPYMRPIYPTAQACGPAVTVLLQPGDNWMMHVVAEQLQPGDVVVAACTAENTDGVFVVPAAGALGVADAAEAREANEGEKRAKLAAGVLGLDMYKMREPLAKAGLKYID